MVSPRSFRVLLLFVLLHVVAVGVQADGLIDIKDTVKKSFKVRPGGTLFLDMDHGNVEIKMRNGNDVLVEIERTVEANDRDEARRILDRHDLSIEERNNNVYIESRFDKSSSFWSRMRSGDVLQVKAIVHVPRDYNVDFTTGAGNVEAGDIRGQVRGRTGAGNLMIGAVNGPVDVASGSGNVSIDGASGRVEANTGAGNIIIRNVRGQVRVNTGAGNITTYITAQPEAESVLNSGAGNITVYLTDRVGVNVDAHASMGSASSDYSLKIEGNWMSKSFSGPVNGGGPALRMKAGVGNIALRRR